MSLQITKGTTDAQLDAYMAALQPYAADHPLAQVDLYRVDEYSIRVRIIDPDFEGTLRSWRHDLVCTYLEKLHESATGYLSALILLAPSEREWSLSSIQFDEGQDEE